MERQSQNEHDIGLLLALVGVSTFALIFIVCQIRSRFLGNGRVATAETHPMGYTPMRDDDQQGSFEP